MLDFVLRLYDIEKIFEWLKIDSISFVDIFHGSVKSFHYSLLYCSIDQANSATFECSIKNWRKFGQSMRAQLATLMTFYEWKRAKTLPMSVYPSFSYKVG